MCVVFVVFRCVSFCGLFCDCVVCTVWLWFVCVLCVCGARDVFVVRVVSVVSVLLVGCWLVVLFCVVMLYVVCFVVYVCWFDSVWLCVCLVFGCVLV